MKRQMLAGLTLAGALTLWAGAAAAAEEESGNPAEALLQQAQAYTAMASDAVSTCAEAKISSFEKTPAPAGVSADAWEEAVEKANEQVMAIVESTQAQLQGHLDSFADAVEAADEEGAALPDLTAFKAVINGIADPTNKGKPACDLINNVTITPPSPSVTSERDDTEREGPDTEHHSGTSPERD